jgi:hypothetical protein
MIVTGSGISETYAEEAGSSLDEQVKELRRGGKLEAGKKTSERLKWSEKAHSAAKEFEGICFAQAYILCHDID